MNIGRSVNAYSTMVRRNTATRMNVKASNARFLGVGFDNLLSKSKPKMSDDDFKKSVIEQAQKDMAKGIFQGDTFKSMEKSYVSVVSPDRKGIISNNYSSLFRNGTSNYIKVTHSSGSPSSGGVIADYIPGQGWSAIGTREETARAIDIRKVYNDAWNAAAKLAQGNTVKSEEKGGSLDLKA